MYWKFCAACKSCWLQKLPFPSSLNKKYIRHREAVVYCCSLNWEALSSAAVIKFLMWINSCFYFHSIIWHLQLPEIFWTDCENLESTHQVQCMNSNHNVTLGWSRRVPSWARYSMVNGTITSFDTCIFGWYHCDWCDWCDCTQKTYYWHSCYMWKQHVC